MRIENFIDYFIWASDFVIYSEIKVNFEDTVELILMILKYLFKIKVSKPKSEKGNGED